MSISDIVAEQIKEQKSQSYATKRCVVEELEDILFEPLKVLDHGFVRLIDYMGNDGAVVQAARVSYGIGTKQVNQDTGLIRYLLRHKHTTPFEMCEIKFHIKMPIFIARQWIRHRTANVNEYSARYSVMADNFYIPSYEQLASQSTKNHQGRGEEKLSPQEAEHVRNILKSDSETCYKHYMELMNIDKDGEILDPNNKGIARELARMNLPVNIYTEWYWKIDLHNLLHFLHLRADSHAQYEIREYANIILSIVEKWVPITYKAFRDYKVGSYELSAQALDTVKKMLKGEEVKQEDSGLSKREWDEFTASLNI